MDNFQDMPPARIGKTKAGAPMQPMAPAKPMAPGKPMKPAKRGKSSKKALPPSLIAMAKAAKKSTKKGKAAQKPAGRPW